ncbi:NAD-dependent epimerase/dehydratase family protein [Paenibacillus kribbensis]|uniref:NAD-dependent epimerase/dehydratase family protein n=1 Tax=Paenibacillus kribbensis TaxID=172713 RepID=UPI00083918AF|nr:NAD-dependent epimerase/dehydratase family protein [Paenibacillus kribbensis]
MDAIIPDSKKTILITGASGFTGRHACQYFVEQGLQVAAFVRRVDDTLPQGIETYLGDLLDKERLREVLECAAPDYVLHLGGKNSVPDSWEQPLLYMQTNILSTLYLLDALRMFPACRTVIVGSRLSFELTVPYRPSHPYSLSKSLQKAAALSWQELFGQQVILAEPSNLIGPGPSTGFCALLARYIVRCERGEESHSFTVSSRSKKRDFLDVRDAIRAYDLLLRQGEPGEIYQVCSGTETGLGNVADKLLSFAKETVSVEWGSEPLTLLEKPLSYQADQLEKWGWKPQIPLTASLYDIVQYFRREEGSV